MIYLRNTFIPIYHTKQTTRLQVGVKMQHVDENCDAQSMAIETREGMRQFRDGLYLVLK